MIITPNHAYIGPSKIDLTVDTKYTHPTAKQCNYTYSHPSTIQCNASTEINSLKASVSNGKIQVANAITGKGVSASGNDSFATLASKIGQIQSRNAFDKQVSSRFDPIVASAHSYYPDSCELINGNRIRIYDERNGSDSNLSATPTDYDFAGDHNDEGRIGWEDRHGNEYFSINIILALQTSSMRWYIPSNSRVCLNAARNPNWNTGAEDLITFSCSTIEQTTSRLVININFHISNSSPTNVSSSAGYRKGFYFVNSSGTAINDITMQIIWNSPLFEIEQPFTMNIYM